MAKVERTTREQFDVPEHQNGDPAGIAIKAFLDSGDPLPDDLTGKYEFRIKIQTLDHRGRVVQRVGVPPFTKLDTLFDDVVDVCGPGRYTVWVSYRGVGDEQKWKLVKVPDIPVTDGTEELPARMPYVEPESANGVAPIPQQERKDVLDVLVAMMQQQTQVMIALLTKQSSGSGARELLEAINVGANLSRGGTDEGSREPQDPVDRMLGLAEKVLEVVASGNDKSGELGKLVSESGLDKEMNRQGFQALPE